MATTVYGDIAVAAELEIAVRDLLQKWFPSYLREVERQNGWDDDPLPTPRNYIIRNSFDAEPGEEMPKVAVISPGLWEVPEHPAVDGYYQATWQVGVGVAIAAETEDEANRRVKMYGAAARAICLQHQTLEREDLGVCYVSWLDESYDDLPINDQFANYKAAAINFGVEVNQATSRFMRPSLPSEAPETTVDIDTVIITFPDYSKTVTVVEEE
jgi:hypothetical protein